VGPIIIRNSIVPKLASIFISVYAITLFPFIFIRDKGDDRVIRHETIHFKQYLETLIIGFLIIYSFDFLKGLIKYKNVQTAYRQIRFEQEAYENDHHLYYQAARKRWAWRKYKV
jgi:branched-subunit amino acid transport protein AzlD